MPEHTSGIMATHVQESQGITMRNVRDEMPERSPIKKEDMPLRYYIRSRLVSPVAVIKAVLDPINHNYSIKNILFTARYISGKAISGYDYSEDNMRFVLKDGRMVIDDSAVEDYLYGDCNDWL